MSAKDRQEGGDHYLRRDIEPWDVWRAYPELGSWLHNALKYILRCKDKGSMLEDLKKAKHYIEYEIERIEEDERDS